MYSPLLLYDIRDLLLWIILIVLTWHIAIFQLFLNDGIWSTKLHNSIDSHWNFKVNPSFCVVSTIITDGVAYIGVNQHISRHNGDQFIGSIFGYLQFISMFCGVSSLRRHSLMLNRQQWHMSRNINYLDFCWTYSTQRIYRAYLFNIWLNSSRQWCIAYDDVNDKKTG